MNDVVLESERLYLKEFVENDVEKLHRLNNDVDVMKYIKPPETEVSVAKNTIKRLIKYYIENHGLGVWAGYERKSDEFVGFFELAHLDNTEEIEVGYRLHKEYWNKGYATEMTKVLIDYGFNIIKLDKIVGITHPKNIASQNVLLKSGLTYIKDDVFFGYLDKYYAIEKQKRSE